MSKLDDFKQFVKNNPGLIKYIRNDEMTWQKFYEMYDLYGEDNSIWDDYRSVKKTQENVSNVVGFDFLNWIKNIDIDSFQENINSVKRVISVLQEMGVKDNSNTSSTNYKPRPIYKHFED